MRNAQPIPYLAGRSVLGGVRQRKRPREVAAENQQPASCTWLNQPSSQAACRQDPTGCLQHNPHSAPFPYVLQPRTHAYCVLDEADQDHGANRENTGAKEVMFPSQAVGSKSSCQNQHISHIDRDGARLLFSSYTIPKPKPKPQAGIDCKSGAAAFLAHRRTSHLGNKSRGITPTRKRRRPARKERSIPGAQKR